MKLVRNRRWMRGVAMVGLLLAASAIGPLAWGQLDSASAQGVPTRPVIVPVTPFRLFDTRPAPDDATGGPDEPFGEQETRSYAVAGVGSVPGDAVGVVLNVTAVGATADSFLTVFPAGSDRPLASTLNPFPGRIVFNSATVLLGGGAFSVYNHSGSVHVLADVVGYLVDHNHDERYATLGTGGPTDHNHDGIYAAINHHHNAVYAAINHNHNTVYAALNHNHDNRYLEQSGPMVLMEPASGWIPADREPLNVPTTFEPAGHLLFASTDGSLALPLQAPASIGGTNYRLSQVEYCIVELAAPGMVDTAFVFGDLSNTGGNPNAVVATDTANRAATGCYTVTVPASTARAFSLVLVFDGSPGETVGLSATRTTWVPV
jgi:hypothetical protein